MTLPIMQRNEASDSQRSKQRAHQLQPNAATQVEWDSFYRSDDDYKCLQGLKDYKCMEYVHPCSHKLYFKDPVVTLTTKFGLLGDWVDPDF
jgi:hypothetical protein